MEIMGLKFTPVVVRHLLVPLGMFGPMAGTSWTNRGFNPPPAAHPPQHPPSPPPTLPTAHPNPSYLPTPLIPYSGKVWRIDSFRAYGQRKFDELIDQPTDYLL